MVFTTLDTLQLKKTDNWKNINSVKTLHLLIGEVIGHIEEKNVNKYLVFYSSDENKEVLKKYNELCDRVKN